MIVLLAVLLQSAPNELTPEEKNEGYVLLFNGKDLSGFKAGPRWLVQDGVLTFRPVNRATEDTFTPAPLWTEASFENYVLKVDFRTDQNPESGHSAVILRSDAPKSREPNAIEVSITGPARKVGHFCTGAFRYHLQAPTKAAARPAGEWNTFVLTAAGGRIQVELNGEVVNQLDLDEWTQPGRRPDGSSHLIPKALQALSRKSPIGFRDDFGIPVWFRNLKLKPLRENNLVAFSTRENNQVVFSNTLTEQEVREGWKLLFNGRDLNGFRASSNSYVNYGKWIVEEGTIGLSLYGGYPHYVPPLHLFTVEEYENYVLKVDFRLSSTKGQGHSGIILRIGDAKFVETTTLETAIYATGARPGMFCTGAFRHDLRNPDAAAARPQGEWNSFVFTVRGPIIEVELNGEKVNRLDLNEWATPGKRPDGTAHKMTRMAPKDLPVRSAIGFREDHGTPVWFRNLKLKPLE